ncbi:1,2-phenylacetyl-CoA epoxidase subunit PaaD [Variovorax terrae]|uniref:Phenylacetate-CoA oxygenase subunit PaaJ n=1 Tax=Variovorax terrae TaxID=2923278 RepID=A0A9X1VR05_9BURK|nr:phenylacetate-CoA oxygenase subunit PaaJ [Variovorax terrae]
MVNAVAQAWAALEAVPDPEIPVVSIRELGILREVRPDGDGLEVVITPTYSGCPAMDQIGDDIRATLAREGLSARITTQLAPAWTTDWISDAARDKLRAYGIAPPHAVAAPQAGHVIRFAPKKSTSDGPPAPTCPHCGSPNTTETSHFSSTACKALHKCLDCLEPFDYFKPY